MKSAGQYLLKIAVLIRINNALNQIKNENKNIRVCLLLVALIATTKSTSARQEVHSKLSVLQPRHAAQSRNILYKALLWQTMELFFMFCTMTTLVLTNSGKQMAPASEPSECQQLKKAKAGRIIFSIKKYMKKMYSHHFFALLYLEGWGLWLH